MILGRAKMRERHRWFAWYPVRAGHMVLWLQWVEREYVRGCVWPYWRYYVKDKAGAEWSLPGR